MPSSHQIPELPDGFAGELLRRLAGRQANFDRYRLDDEVGAGAMGTIHRVFDEDLRRSLAMKVLHEERTASAEDSTMELKMLGRFLEEAQVTSQLDHPGIVPVHELGIDRDGHVYFTMKLVKGRDLEDVFELHFAGEGGWNRTRVLGVILKVCEAMSYAHDKGVIHRDLKPSNIMVGKYGEAYVMDWGLARVLDRDDPKDIRIRPESAPSTIVHSDRRDRSGSDPGTPLYTMDGDVVGTPCYMSPEQAKGELERLGPKTDVYAIGCVLYHLLSEQLPYVSPGTPLNNYLIWARVQDGPPKPLHELAPDTPAELLAICEKAMAREPSARYASMEALADDLRAYLEGRVVVAHRTGPWTEFRKWAARNRGIAASLAGLIAVGLVSAIAVATLEGRRADAARALADEARLRADELAAAALVEGVDELWPIHPDRAGAMREWLEQARALTASLPEHRARLASLREGAEPTTIVEPETPEFGLLRNRRDSMQQKLDEDLEKLINGTLEPEREALVDEMIPTFEREIPALTARLEANEAERTRVTWSVDESVAEEHARWEAFVADLETLERTSIPIVDERLQAAETLEQRTVDAFAAEWAEASASIADRTECPLYRGLRLAPQAGLVPLRRNRQGLWEFWHVLSGERPEIDGDDYVLTGDTGIVLVLVPGGSLWIGVQTDDPDLPNFLPTATDADGIVEAELEPYLLAKYEMTIAQWERVTGERPNEYWVGRHLNGIGKRIGLTHPVEQVSWDEAFGALARWNLGLPTEAQWERAARSGLEHPFGAAGTLSPKSFNSGGSGDLDGFRMIAPVDEFEPNPFGLHGMLGNVSEWCLDWWARSYDLVSVVPLTGELQPKLASSMSARGGNFASPATECTPWKRMYSTRNAHLHFVGVRPARRIERENQR